MGSRKLRVDAEQEHALHPTLIKLDRDGMLVRLPDLLNRRSNKIAELGNDGGKRDIVERNAHSHENTSRTLQPSVVTKKL